MTKQEFETLRKICQKEWLTLAKTGSEKHTLLVRPFHCGCPACEIDKLTGATYTERCVYCPIDVWRRKGEASTACSIHPSPYASWIEVSGDLEFALEEDAEEEVISEFRRALKEQARIIAALKWSWLPEYKYTQLTEKVKEAIKLFEESEQH